MIGSCFKHYPRRQSEKLCRCGYNDVIEKLKTSRENSNTGKSTNLWVGEFKK
jgi:hypothetical protein